MNCFRAVHHVADRRSTKPGISSTRASSRERISVRRLLLGYIAPSWTT
jgi:hypothetical protein